MNISHVGSPHRRLPLPARRLLSDLAQPLSAALHGSARLLAALAFSVAALTTQATAALTFGVAPAPLGGFEAGASDWAADGSGPWRQAPANALSITTAPREGLRAVKFLPKAGEIRSEFTLNDNLGVYNWGTEYWMGFSIRVIQPVPGNAAILQHHSTPATVNNVVDWDHHSGENSIAISTRVTTGGQDYFQVSTSTNASLVNVVPSQSAYSGHVNATPYNYTRNRWYDFVIHFRLATDTTGIMEVWIKDTVTGVTTKKVDVVGSPTVYRYDSGISSTAGVPNRAGLPKTPKHQQKIGMYYGPNVSGGEVDYDSFRIWQGAGGSIAAVSPVVGGTAPNAPTGLTATPASSTQINLDWNPVSPTPTGYRVYRGATAGTVTTNVSNNLGSGTTAFNNTGLTPGQTYFYAARAYNSIGESGNSNIVSQTAAVGSPIVLDANALPFTTSTTANPATDVITINGATGGNFLRFNGNAVNNSISFTVNQPGTYTIGGNFRKTPYSGKFQLLIDNSPQGAVFDGWASSGAFALGSFGTKTLSAGNHTFKFLVTGQNTSSTGFQIGIDTITLTP